MSSAVLNMRGTTEPTHAVIKDCTFESNLSMVRILIMCFSKIVGLIGLTYPGRLFTYHFSKYYGGVISATGRGSLYVTRSIFQGGRALVSTRYA